MGDVTTADLRAWVERFAALVDEHQTELTDLDSAIGDADHGANMTRGMHAVIPKLADAGTPAELGKAVGMTLVSTVGGASGPLYGTFFLRMGSTAGTADSLDASALGAALRAGVEGVVQRGKAEPGDKTMIDAFTPALQAWDDAVAAGADAATAADAAAKAAATGRDATTPLVARKGRASYLGERSAGHLDPGAASATLLLQALRDVLRDTQGDTQGDTQDDAPDDGAS